MKNYKCLEQLAPSNFNKTFLAFSPSSEDVEYGELYGAIVGNRFCIYQKVPPRSFKNLANHCLQCQITKEGHIEYRYRRTVQTFALTIITPLLMLLLGCFFGGVVLGIEELYACLFPATFLLLCNFIPCSALKKSLLGFLLHIVYVAQVTVPRSNPNTPRQGE